MISLLGSTIFGSEIVVETPNNTLPFGVADSLLGALEAFLATSEEADVLPYREHITVVVSPSDKMEGVPQLCFSDGDGGADIVHPVDSLGPPLGRLRQAVESGEASRFGHSRMVLTGLAPVKRLRISSARRSKGIGVGFPCPSWCALVGPGQVVRCDWDSNSASPKRSPADRHCHGAIRLVSCGSLCMCAIDLCCPEEAPTSSRTLSASQP